MKKFGIYTGQFDINHGDIKAYDTMVIGEVDLTAKEYLGKSLDEACNMRLKAELRPSKRISEETDNYLYDHLINTNFFEVEYDGEKGADKRIHAYLKEVLGYSSLKGEKRDTEFFDLGIHACEIIQNAINKVFGKVKKEVFTPSKQQDAYITKIKTCIELFKLTSNVGTSYQIMKFLLGALCRFGKTASTLFAHISVFKYKKILILSAKCDTKNSWYDDFLKWTFADDYKFVFKEDFRDNPNILKENEKVIAWMSLQSSAKLYDEANDLQEYEKEPWQKIVAKEHWDSIILDECHFGVDTQRSQKFIRKIFENSPYALMEEISATPIRKLQRGEYSKDNSFIYTVADEKNDFNNGRINKTKYVPMTLHHLDLINLFNNNGLNVGGKKMSDTAHQLWAMRFQSSIKDGKFSWPAFFDQFDLYSIGLMFCHLYDTYYKTNGKNCFIYTNSVEDGKKLAASIPSSLFEIFNECGTSRDPLARINRAMEDAELRNEKPVVVISCGRYLTGVTEKYLHNMIFMGTVNSPENYIQYGCRPKNPYPGRTAKCAIWDLNTKTILQSDAFKEMLMTEATYKNKNVSEVAKEYADAIAIYDCNDMNILVEKKNFVEDFEKTMYISEDGSPFLKSCISLETLSEDDIRNLVYKTNGKSDALTFSITEEQMQHAECLVKTEYTKDKKHEKTEKQKSIEELLKILREKICYIPAFMKYYNIKTLDDVIADTSLHYPFKLFCHDLDASILIELKHIWSHIPQNWKNLVIALTSNKDNLSNVR